MIYSITSSARASSVGGTSRPSIRALWTLMTSSNLLDCTTGRPGAVEDAPGIDAQMTPGIRQVGSVLSTVPRFLEKKRAQSACDDLIDKGAIITGE